MTITELSKKLKSKTPPTVIDTRSGMEYRMGHIPGALHLPLWRILLRLTGKLPKDKATQLVLYCESGARAQLAGSMLIKQGYRMVGYLDGDLPAWRRAGLALEK